MDTPSPPSPATTSLRRWPLAGRRPAAVAASTLHLLLALPVGIASFVAVVTLGALGLGSLIVYPLAVPVLLAWVAVVRGAAALERGRVRTFTDMTITAPPEPPSAGTWHTRLWAALRHPSTWRAAGYHLLHLPVGVLLFTAVVVAWSVPVWLILLPVSLVGGSLADIAGPLGLLVLAGPLLGVALLPVVAELVDALARLDAAIAASLLGVSRIDRRDDRIERLAATRSDLVDIAEQERRRIERDLHDGAGQQLVSLAMTLGMAREKLRSDPASAQALIDEAHAEAKQALVGLREIVRGISPAILTDRGLGAALSAVAARASLPVSLHVEVPERPDPVTEGIAYYVVCEAIGNATRHAEASRIGATIVRRGDRLELEVRDDGRGGADPRRGSGLRGLAGRVAAVDGDLEVSSPAGGPTILRATLPIRSVQPATGGR